MKNETTELILEFTDVVIDIETLSKRENAVVATVGVVALDIETGLFESHSFSMDILEQIVEMKRHVCPDTQDWWSKQSGEAKDDAFVFHSGGSIHELDQLFRNLKDCRVWGNGPEFDINILQSYFSDLGLDWPFKYWEQHSIRTALLMHEFLTGQKIKKTTEFEGCKHIAIDDAKHEAKLLLNVIRDVEIARGNGISVAIGEDHF